MTMPSDRRAFLRGAGLGASALTLSVNGYSRLAATSCGGLPPFFGDLERRTFAFFRERTDPATGLVPDRWPTPSFASIAAIGLGLTLYPLAAGRGWITRAAARNRTLRTLRFLATLPMGDAPFGTAGNRGFFYHFLDLGTGLRHGRSELSSIDSTMLFMGMLFAGGWFDGDHPHETEIRHLANALVERAEWDWFQRDSGGIPMGWHPEHGFISRIWDGYNEGKMAYVLGLGATRHPLRDGAWDTWSATYPAFWRGAGTTRHLGFGPLFGHQFSEIWIDFRGIRDAPMRAAGFDYFENSRRATYANRAYAIANPMGWDGYGPNGWGLSACDGPGDFTLPRSGREARFYGYAARGPLDEPDPLDDGTLCPAAVVSAIPFAPEIAIPATLAMLRRDPRLYGRYGFVDGYNPSFHDTAAKVETGNVDSLLGWVGGDWLGLDQGALLASLANYRSEAVWKVMRRVPAIARGLRRAGFTGGWLGA